LTPCPSGTEFSLRARTYLIEKSLRAAVYPCRQSRQEIRGAQPRAWQSASIPVADFKASHALPFVKQTLKAVYGSVI
jgi:hypothetical protein